MTLVNELIVAVVGGVMTAVILEIFSRNRSAVNEQPVRVREPAPRRDSIFGQLFRLVLAVVGGIAIAMIGGRMLIQMDVLPRGLPTRFGLLVAGTMLCWLVLLLFRRR